MYIAAVLRAGFGITVLAFAVPGWAQGANGCRVTSESGQRTVEVSALKDDVLRVRAWTDGKRPEDASWAVLPEARSACTTVTKDGNGFQTQALRVQVDKSTLTVTISDLSGNVISQDVPGWPVEWHGESFRVHKAMPEDEHYFGLGDKTGPLDRRGSAFVMWNTDAYRFQESTDPLYKDVPFFIAVRAGKSYGLLLDNTWRTSFDFGKEMRDAYSFGSDGGVLDYYFIYGPEPKRVVEEYAWLTGPTPLPPLWSLGFQQSRYSYMTDGRVREIADRFRKDRIPVDAIYLDIDYQLKNRPFTVDTTAFPDFSKLISDLRAEHIHTVLITDLHIAHVTDGSYKPYDEGAAGDHFVKNADGSVFVGPVWPGPAVFPEFTRKSSREYWGSLYKEFDKDGVAGFWNDMNEPAVFENAAKTMPLTVQDRIDEPGFAKRTTTQREIHNVFGMLNSRGTYEGLLKLHPDQRPFVLTRATYAGGQRYAATWTGDNSSTWNHMRMSIPMLLNLGLSGFAMAGDDIGGYAGSPQMDLLTKWLELGAFNPIYRDHTEKNSADQEPWAGGNGPGGAEAVATRKRYIEERYRLLPYIYTAGEETSRTGVPMMRPLFLEFPTATADKHPLDLDAGSEFMWGPGLLVAANPWPEQPDGYAVALPSQGWFDYWTGKKVEGNVGGGASVSTGAAAGLNTLTMVEVKPAIAELPVYVRPGTILPVQPLVQSTDERPDGPLELRIYPGSGDECKGSVYVDDGISFKYKQGEYLRQDFNCESEAGEFRLRIGAQQGKFAAWWKELVVAVYDWPNAEAHVTLDGKAVSGAGYDAAAKVLRVRIPARRAGGELRITDVAGK